jgi:hypothetical protein
MNLLYFINYDSISIFCSHYWCLFSEILTLSICLTRPQVAYSIRVNYNRGHPSRIRAVLLVISFSMKGSNDNTFTLDVFSIVSTIISF